jgi:polar amino acid transport system permease protein
VVIPHSGEADVTYTFHFEDIWAAREELFWGTMLTLELSALSMVLSLIVAVFGALGRTGGPRWLRAIIAAYVEFIRNTPFLVQVFVIFFGLPAVGIRLEANVCAVIAMVLNGSAYTIEIVRAGIESIGHGQTEAARALGLHRLQSFRLIVLPQALRAVMPPLGSQFILLMLNSSIVSVISAEELTAATMDIQSRTFRSFEAYITAMVIYFALSSLFSGVFAAVERFAFAKPATR